MNFGKLIKLKDRWPIIRSQHADLIQYFKNQGKENLQEGTRIQILFTRPDGTQSDCDLTLTKEDMETAQLVKDAISK